MTEEQQQLWQKINDFELDDSEHSLTFTDRLARENGWSTEFAIRAVFEYKKFIFLIIISEFPLTPSDHVDRVWHLHLLYTRSYWIDLCEDTLGKQIHHGPTEGGSHENEKFTNWYEKTKEFYTTLFTIPPPADIWPSSEIRFSEINFQRVNLHRNWIISKPTFLTK